MTQLSPEDKPPPAISGFNSTGGKLTIARNKDAGYTVTLGALARSGDVQVSAYGNSLNGTGLEARCKVVDWGQGSGGPSINVRCYGPNGIPVEENFSLAYAVGDPFGLVPGVRTLGAWAFANDPTSTNVYTPELGYQYNGLRHRPSDRAKDRNRAIHNHHPRTLSYTTSVALATAYGKNSNYCSIASWTISAIDVACYDNDGAPANTVFDVTLQTAR